MKIKSRPTARTITMAVMAIGLMLSAQMLVAGALPPEPPQAATTAT